MSNKPYIVQNFVDDSGRLGTARAVGAPDYPISGDPYPGVDLTQKFAAEIAEAGGAPQAWIKAKTQAGSYSGIHVNDWLPLRANNVDFRARIMGIDTYTGYGDSEVPHHIDWMLEELWPTQKPINPANYNNGLIPVENVVSDGESIEYTLSKEMHEIASITLNDVELSGWDYNNENFKIKFEEAPAAGTLVVTGTGTEYPWLACDAYLYANSMAGHVPNGTTVNPPVTHVDYTQDGIYYHLPQEWKDIIIQKRMYLPKRYSATGVLNNSNGGGWTDIGYIWFPTECEVYGQGVWANTGIDMGGSALQYPLFSGNMNRIKKRNESRRRWWLLSAYSGNSGSWCSVQDGGNAHYNGSSVSMAFCVCFRTA